LLVDYFDTLKTVADKIMKENYEFSPEIFICMYIFSVGAQNWAKDHPIVVCIHIGQKTGYPKGSIAVGMRLHFFYRQGKSTYMHTKISIAKILCCKMLF
jgi:hypothetical protein